MKRNKAIKKQKARTGKKKGESLYKRKYDFLVKVKMWGFEFPIGQKPWK